MQANIFGPRRWRTVQAFGKNPLVRMSDRIEAILVLSAVAISLLAVPVAGAIGTAVYDARSRVYADEAHTRRPISAVVTATRRGVAVVRPYMDSVVAEARWRSEGIDHTESFSVAHPVTVGDHIDIWVGDGGERVKPPPPFSAVVEAVCVAVPLWLVVTGAAAVLVAFVRRQLDRRHDTDWQREIQGLVDRRSAD
jgi:hypothetical protein